MKRLISMAIVGAVALTIGVAGSASATGTTTGTWSQYPKGATTYQADVQQPINTANTSNWSSKSKGGIPVMFKLSSGTGPAAFESIYSDNPGNMANNSAWASFHPDPAMTFSQITNLSADYTFTLGDCHGGSIRWEIGTADGKALNVYYGEGPNFTDCTTNNQSGTNMLVLSDLRFDTSQYAGGTWYDTYTHALALMGSQTVSYAELVIDGGWQNAPNGDQRATVSNITVNDNVYQWNPGGNGTFAPTCDLPPATIQVGKTDPVADGDVNEQTVQGSLTDSGNAFRVVDCKYQYVLSIPSLSGPGTYHVEIKIDGTTVPTPNSPGGKVKFDLK